MSTDRSEGLSGAARAARADGRRRWRWPDFERAALAGLGISVAALYLMAGLGGDLALPGAPARDGGLPQGLARFAPPPQTEVEIGARRLAKPTTVTMVASAKRLSSMFEGMGYRLEHVRADADPVPRVFLASFPEDLETVDSVDARKAVFFRTMLPLVLKVNETILLERGRLLALRQRLEAGHELTPKDRMWLADMAADYGLESPDIDHLLARVDVVPPSLALAQAAEESGWGTSRFALEGNAPFGQWTYEADDGLAPRKRKQGSSHFVRAYDHLLDGVWSYVHNLNTHGAYREFRRLRTKLRREGRVLDGYALAAKLTRYSERGQDYVRSIRTIIEANNLRPFDRARLSGAQIAKLAAPGR